MIQDASEGVQLLMLNPNQAPSSISNSCAAVNGKGSAVTPKSKSYIRLQFTCI